MRGKSIPVIFAAALCVAGGATAALSAPTRTRVAFPGVDVGGGEPVRVIAILTRPPGDGPFPAIVLLHTAGGVKKHTAEEWPDYFAGIGYASLTVDSFGSRGIENFSKHAVSARAMAGDAYGALRYLAARPFIDRTKIGVMGFSMGAFTVNSQMMRPPVQKRVRGLGINFRAGIGMYGPCDVLAKLHRAAFPLLQIIGDRDLFAEQCAALDKSIFPVVLLPGVYHNFDDSEDSNKTDARGNYRSYDEAATNKARELAKQFFAKIFAGAGRGAGAGAGGAMPGSAVQAALSGKTISYSRPHGTFSIYFEPGGAALTRSSRVPGKTLHKKWWVDGDRLCRTVGRDNKELCFKVRISGDTATFLKRNGKPAYDAKIVAGNRLAQ